MGSSCSNEKVTGLTPRINKCLQSRTLFLMKCLCVFKSSAFYYYLVVTPHRTLRYVSNSICVKTRLVSRVALGIAQFVSTTLWSMDEVSINLPRRVFPKSLTGQNVLHFITKHRNSYNLLFHDSVRISTLTVSMFTWCC